MTLTPLREVEEIFKSVPDDFNYRAAAKTYEAIMKMDTEEARLFTSMVANEVCWDTIAKNRRTLQRHLDEVTERRIDAARRSIAKAYRRDGPSEELALMASAVEELAKADRPLFDPDEHPRGEGGMFRTRVHHDLSKPPMHPDDVKRARDANRMEEPLNQKKYPLSDEKKSRFQQEYHQVAQFLASAQHSGHAAEGSQMRLTVENDQTGELRFATQPVADKVDRTKWRPDIEHVVGAEVVSDKGAPGAPANVAKPSFNILSAMGVKPRKASDIATGVQAAGDGMGDFGEAWNSTPDQNSSNSRLYNRVQGGGQYLSNIAPAGSKLQMAGEYSKWVGSHGPEAERVFGPPTRKFMYRYRGTERKMDPELQEATTHASQAALDRAERQKALLPSERRRAGAGDDAPKGSDAARAATWGLYARYLAERLPKKQYSKLQLDAGETPPSEGIIIDRNGKGTVQAVGYGGDHYLPFNLRNLKGLKGGEYIRTRSVGGPTSEDIYTGLHSDAKRLTVISRSGVFTVDFEDDFTGTRRHSQKAIRMIDRYERLLDSVNSKSVVRNEMGVDEKRQIQSEVEDDLSLKGATPAQIQAETSRRIKERIATNNISTEEFKNFEEKRWPAALAQHEGESEMDPRQKRALKTELYHQMLDEKAANYELNGPGYEAALKALQEQFPYYIKDTHFEPRIEGISEPTASRDQGYVVPGRLRPTEARGNYHNSRAHTNIGGLKAGRVEQEEESAADMDYQGGYSNPKPNMANVISAPVTATDAAKTGQTEVEGEVKGPDGKVLYGDARQRALLEQKHALEAGQAQRNFEEGVVGLVKEYRELPKAGTDDAPWLKRERSDEEIREYARNPRYKQQMMDYFKQPEVRDYAQAYNIKDYVERVANLQLHGGRLGNQAYIPSVHRKNPSDHPFKFSGEKGYEPGQPADVYERTLAAKYKGMDSTFTGERIEDMDDDQLKAEITKAANAHEAVELALKPENKAHDKAFQLNVLNVAGQGFGDHKIAVQAVQDDDITVMDKYLDRLQEIRAVKAAQKTAVTSGAGAAPKAPSPPDPLNKRNSIRKMKTTKTMRKNLKTSSGHLVGLNKQMVAHTTIPRTNQSLDDLIDSALTRCKSLGAK